MRELRIQKLRQDKSIWQRTSDLEGLTKPKIPLEPPPPPRNFPRNRGISKAMFAFTSTFELYQETAAW